MLAEDLVRTFLYGLIKYFLHFTFRDRLKGTPNRAIERCIASAGVGAVAWVPTEKSQGAIGFFSYILKKKKKSLVVLPMWGIHFRFSEKKEKKRMPEQFLCDLLEFGIVKAVGKGILAGNTHDVAFFFNR